MTLPLLIGQRAESNALWFVELLLCEGESNQIRIRLDEGQLRLQKIVGLDANDGKACCCAALPFHRASYSTFYPCYLEEREPIAFHMLQGQQTAHRHSVASQRLDAYQVGNGLARFLLQGRGSISTYYVQTANGLARCWFSAGKDGNTHSYIVGIELFEHG